MRGIRPSRKEQRQERLQQNKMLFRMLLMILGNLHNKYP